MALEGPKRASINFISFFKNSDFVLATGLMGIIGVILIPLPAFLLDFLLVLSITVSITILLVALYMKRPLDFSIFPPLLLLVTLLRLSLNIASTKAILLRGAEGTTAAGHVIDSFGKFVVGGNIIVGVVIFSIFFVINFIVITKGAGRVAEVAARFTLDAMPGKQMAIDADLSAGIIDMKMAKLRRREIEHESEFYGSMDGASKFVRGDAIAAIIITAINIVVGFVIGMLQYDMAASEAARTFTIMTVGDGIVSQVPAFLTSIAAGMVVTRTGSSSHLGGEISKQFRLHPNAFFVASLIVFIIGLTPGLPVIPFWMLAVIMIILGYLSIVINSKEKQKALREANLKEEEVSTESIDDLLKIDLLSLEIGYGLIPLVDKEQGGELLERIMSIRKQFAVEMGIVVPSIHVKDNLQLLPGDYRICIKGNMVAKGSLREGYLLAMDTGAIEEPVEGISTKEPAFGLDALWIKPSLKDEAGFRGYTVVDNSTVVATHITQVLKDNSYQLIGRQEVQSLIDGMKDEFPKVIDDMLSPDCLSLGEVVKVLHNLLKEDVSIKDLLTIFETLADKGRQIKDPDLLTESVRLAIGRTIVSKYLSNDDVLHVVNLERTVEDVIANGIKYTEGGSSFLQLDPNIAEKILAKTNETIEAFQMTNFSPILLVSPSVRMHFRKLIERFIPSLTIISYEELPPGTRTKSLGVATL